MNALSLVLMIKILGTLFPVALPLLLAPKAVIDRRSGFTASDPTFYRLYGMALLALLVGYAGGFLQLMAGVFPTGILIMGLVSNAGATLFLLLSPRSRKAPWEVAFFGSIALALTASLLFPDLMTTPLW